MRVLYKKVGQVPEIRIIPNIWKLKKEIVKKELEIIPYETLYIVCYNKEKRKYLPINIVLDFNHIAGDFILIGIDKAKREFKEISHEDVVWYLQDLINKEFTPKTTNLEVSKKKYLDYSKTNFSNSLSKTNTFEENLINVLTNIELTLANLLASSEENKQSEDL